MEVRQSLGLLMPLQLFLVGLLRDVCGLEALYERRLKLAKVRLVTLTEVVPLLRPLATVHRLLCQRIQSSSEYWSRSSPTAPGPVFWLTFRHGSEGSGCLSFSLVLLCWCVLWLFGSWCQVKCCVCCCCCCAAGCVVCGVVLCSWWCGKCCQNLGYGKAKLSTPVFCTISKIL